ncbi:anti-anti-sigma factor [Catellatospora methionotrophica]|uniref:Anti-anti-sigma factor n=1 Tax=Catellatospora methionotrophica TaxID=121620 RepID=A0A8J3PHD2_9ACTN|nr:STAS domain-containing protein [Catellatospora methionotrophica]GIG16609.1 anti-anti-sigma factor [Catellatospora methionotrophica]
MTATPLDVSTARTEDGSTRLTICGEIDMTNSARLAEAISSASAPVLLDFAAVEYLDSAGLAVLFAQADRIELVANRMLLPVLTVSGLTELISVREAPAG